MKKLYTLIAVASLVFAGNAVAQTANSNAAATNAQRQSNTGFNNGQGQLQGQAVQLGNTGNATGGGVGNNYSQTQVAASDLGNAVGFAQAPALTTTLTETCMGSTSVGAGFSGGSFAFGTTWRDSACVRRLDAREIKTFGDIQAAKEIMCDSDLVRAAFKRVGRPCSEDGGTYVAVSAPAAPAEPVVEAPVAPATDVKVHDDQDEMAQRNKAILQKADDAREIMRSKGF